MGDINTNIRIDELETFVNGLASAVNSLADSLDAIPSFYKMKDHAHSEDITAEEFADIKAAVDAGKIILTGKITRQDYTLAENVPVVWASATNDEIILQTFARAYQPGSTTAQFQCPMILDIKHQTASVIRIFVRDANYYPGT